MKRIKVYYWNPNGTNDIEILDENHEVIDSLQEALFGLNVGSSDSKIVPLSQVMQKIAVSPVSDGNVTRDLLVKHFAKQIQVIVNGKE